MKNIYKVKSNGAGRVYMSTHLNKGADEGCQDEIGISGIGKYGYAAGIIETWDSQGPRPIHDADDMC